MRDLFPVLRVLGVLTSMFSLSLALPGFLSWGLGESVWPVYPLAALVTLSAGGALWWGLRRQRQELQPPMA